MDLAIPRWIAISRVANHRPSSTLRRRRVCSCAESKMLKVHRAVDAENVRLVSIDDPAILIDVDTPAALAELRRRNAAD